MPSKTKECEYCGKNMIVNTLNQRFHKECFVLYRKEYYKRPEIKQINKNYYQRTDVRKKINKRRRDNPQYLINSRKYYQKNKEKIKMYNQIYQQKYHKTEKAGKVREKSYRINQKQIKARRKSAHIKIPKDFLCLICKENIATQKHHEDYDKPLEVMFVCNSCHGKLRRKNVLLER